MIEEIKLRIYQHRLVQKIKVALPKFKRILAQAVTRSGKTIIFVYICIRMNNAGKKVLIIIHKEEIFQQIFETLTKFGVCAGQVKAGKVITKNNIQVAMVRTLKNRLKEQERIKKKYGYSKFSIIEKPDLLIHDETHHIAGKEWGEVADYYSDVPQIGFTATVNRMDNKPLSPFFDTLITGESMRWMMDNNWICDCFHLCPKSPLEDIKLKIKNKDYDVDPQIQKLTGKLAVGDIIKNYRKYLDGLQTICFVCNIKHADIMKEKFNEAGIKSEIITSKTKQRKKVMDDFRNSVFQILISIDILSEGVSVDVCFGVMFLRKTKSESVYLQQGSRPLTPMYADGYDIEDDEQRRKAMTELKPRGIILDFVGNFWEHGRMDKDRFWTLEAKTKKQRAENKIKKITCPKCFFDWEADTKICPACGHSFEIAQREKKEFEMHELKEELINVNSIEEDSADALAKTILKIKEYPNKRKAMFAILHNSIRDGEGNIRNKISAMCSGLGYDEKYKFSVWKFLRKTHGSRMDNLA